jgi:chemotaxis protein MotB
MASTFFRVVVGFCLGGAVAAGAYAYFVRADSAKRIQDLSASEHTCQDNLSECKKAREGDQDAQASMLDQLDASRGELTELRQQREEAEKRVAALKSLTEKFRKMIDSGKLQVILRHGRMVVKLPAGILFESGKAEISKEGKDALREVAQVLRQVPDRRLMVAGHTDNFPLVPTSPFKSNLELSTERALTVAQQLIASGIPPARLVAAGYAEHEPVRENSTEAGRHENRRIEIVLLPNVTELPIDILDAGAKPAASASANPWAAAADASADAAAKK